ncbi:HGGxSTG domain-containing protein [Accumulibacter sp.]|uniref:HGGxSTG domain-containing protein n=1 Tax=Accumulibacter sp. TaxID=2053492 RepID=UPI00338F2B2A
MTDPYSDKRRRWRAYWDLQRYIWNLRFDRGHRGAIPVCPPMPADLWNLPCGAKTRAGTPCKITALYFGGRCKWHGGLSTGPKSEAGKEQCRINGQKGGRPKKQETDR